MLRAMQDARHLPFTDLFDEPRSSCPMSDFPPLSVRVSGELACFSRPEMKVERVSYEVMTPSAARGVLEAIYWKPEVQWQVRRIHVLAPVRFASFTRNEVTATADARGNRSAFERGEDKPFYAEDRRTQRHTLALRDVDYVIEADLVPHGRGRGDHPAKHRDIFRRRVARGQCFTQPYLGCREFSAWFGEPDGTERPIDRTVELGRMLYTGPQQTGVGPATNVGTPRLSVDTAHASDQTGARQDHR
jgi:CRISPR-associated protein Cas5d